jgi:hypothetical protein
MAMLGGPEFIINVEDGVRTVYDFTKGSVEGIKDTYDSTKESLLAIAQFFKDVTWIVHNPYLTFKIFLNGTADVIMVLTYVIVVASLFMLMFDYKGGMKYAKISMAVFITIKMVVAAL